MKNIKTITFSCILAAFLASCTGKKEEDTTEIATHPQYKKEDFIAQIQTLQSKISSEEKPDSTTADEAVKAYADFAFNFPKDSLAPNYLFKAADMASLRGHYQQAIIYYQTIQDHYPNFKFVVESLYLQGYIYDNFINNDVKAKEIYEKVIVQYPHHKLAEDSRFAICNLGKSDEELIREFRKKKNYLP